MNHETAHAIAQLAIDARRTQRQLTESETNGNYHTAREHRAAAAEAARKLAEAIDAVTE